jgi:hypothetical protein
MDTSSVDLSGAWSQIWARIAPELQGFDLFLVFLAVVVALAVTVKYIYESRRKGGGDARSVAVGLVIAALLAAPGLIIPLLLLIADGLIAIFIAIIGLIDM